MVERSELSFEAAAVVVAFAFEFADEGGVLLPESGDALRAKDVLGEEAVYELENHVFAYVLPLAVADGFGGLVAVRDSIGACVVGDALAFLAMHAQWVVAGRAVDDAAQLVEPALAAAS